MNLKQLKTELTEFIEMSSKATPGEWKSDGGDLWEIVDGKCGQFTGIEINKNCRTKLADHNATFIARSRNISPKMAEMLLATIELMEDMPFSVKDALEEKFNEIWEALK